MAATKKRRTKKKAATPRRATSQSTGKAMGQTLIREMKNTVGSSSGRSVIDRMPADAQEAMIEIRKAYHRGDFSHLSWPKMHEILVDRLNFPGGISALKNFMRKRT